MTDTATKDDTEHAKQQAIAQVKSIIALTTRLADAVEKEQYDLCDDITQEIFETPLSVETRSGWTGSGMPLEHEEFRILLCTGGPAVQIVGELNEHFEPENIEVQYQDWFTPWTNLTLLTEAEREDLITFCRQFYFGGIIIQAF